MLETFRLWGRAMRDYYWGASAVVVLVPVTYGAIQYPSLTYGAIAATLTLVAFFLIPRQLLLGVSISTAIVATALVPGLSTESGLAQFGAAAASGALVLASLFRSGRVPRRNGFVVALLLLYLITFLATIFNPIANWFYLSAALVALPVGFVAPRVNSAERRVIHRTVIVLALILGGIAIAESFIFDRLLIAQPTIGQSAHAFLPQVVRGEATTGTPLVLGFLLLVAFVLVATAEGHRISRLLAVVVLALGVLATGSASVAAILALGLMLAIFVRASPAVRITGVFIAFCCGALAAVVGQIPEPLVDQVTGANATQRTNSLMSVPRLLDLQSIPNVLFGNGWGGADLLYRTRVLLESRSASIDNQFVTTMVESGVVGFLVLIVAIVFAIRNCRREYIAMLVAMVAMFISFDVLLWAMPATLLFFIAGSMRDQEPNVPESLPNSSTIGLMSSRSNDRSG